MQNSITADFSALPTFLRLDTPAGFLGAEFTLPTKARAWLLLPHPVNFLSDFRYTRRIAELNQLGFATLCCNIQTLQDLHTPHLIHDTAALTDRILAMLDGSTSILKSAPIPIVLCSDAPLTASSVRASVIRDATIDGLITHGGRPEDAGSKYLALQKGNWLALPECASKGFLPTEALHHIHCIAEQRESEQAQKTLKNTLEASHTTKPDRPQSA